MTLANRGVQWDEETPNEFARRIMRQLVDVEPQVSWPLRQYLAQAVRRLPRTASATELESVAWRAYQEWLGAQ